jgi:ATP-binding cassette, subfamily B, bacterial PglK
MSIVRRFWRLLDARQRWILVGLQGLCVVMAFSTLVGIAAIMPFFAVVGDSQEIFRHGVLARLYELGGFASSDAFVTALGLAFIALIVWANAVNMLGTATMNRFAFAVGDTFRVELFRLYLSRGCVFHASRHTAGLLNGLIYEVDRVTGLLQSVFSVTSNGIAVAFIVVSAVFLDPSFTVLAVTILVTGYLLVYAFTRQRLLRNGVAQTRSAAERGSVASDAFAAIKELTIWGAQRRFVDRFAVACGTVTRATSSTQDVSQQPRYVLECLAVAGLVAVALVLRATEARATEWLPQLTFLGLAAYRLLPALQQIFHSAVRVRANFPAFEGIEADLIDARSVDHEGSGAGDVSCARAIAVRNASFSYASGRPPALQNVALEIPRGSMVGIVGPNGSGKTTLIDLLLGLLTPEAGALAIDGEVLTQAQYRSWWSQLAYVPQQIVLLDGSVADNITFGEAAGVTDGGRIAAAVRGAGLEELIATLPNGLAEQIGERGVRLSGGERQRLGLARALYRDSPILVLDEATSALDARGEEQIERTLQELKGRKTIILVTHRLACLRACDVIFEMDHGKIIGRGTYQDLRRASALFRHGLTGDEVQDRVREVDFSVRPGMPSATASRDSSDSADDCSWYGTNGVPPTGNGRQ